MSRQFWIGLAVIPSLFLLYAVVQVARAVATVLRERWQERWSAWHYAFPDAGWRRPFRRLRYRIGLRILRPYLVRYGAYLHQKSRQWDRENRYMPSPGVQRTKAYKEAEERRKIQLQEWFAEREAYRNLTNLTGTTLYGDDPLLGNFTRRNGWPKRFHILTPIPRPWTKDQSRVFWFPWLPWNRLHEVDD